MERLEIVLPLRDQLIALGQRLLALAERREAFVEVLRCVCELGPDRLEIAGRLLGVGESRSHLGGLGLKLFVGGLQFSMRRLAW